MTQTPKLSLIIPAFREAHIIGDSLARVATFLKTNGLFETTEVIVVAAKAGDDTAKIARTYSGILPQLKIVEPGKPVGKGRDVRAGFEVATGDIQVFTDADLATPLHHILETMKIFNDQQADVVIGIRQLDTIHTGVRAFISLFGNVVARLLLGMSVSDTQCGYKAFSRHAAQVIFKRQTVMNWGFDMELLVIAKKHGQNIIQQPINDWHDPRETDNLEHEHRVGLGVAIQTFGELIAIRIKALGGKYS